MTEGSRGRGGRGGGRGRGGSRGELPRDVQVSKKMSRVLRHSAKEEGLTLGPGGYVSVEDLLATRTIKSLKVTFPEIRTIVTSNDKQRFSMIPIDSSSPVPADGTAPATATTTAAATATLATDDNPAHFLIRANQGHSIDVDTKDLLVPLTAENPKDLPAMCVHGTTAAAWPSILSSGGLKRMARNHIHFAAGLPAGFKPIQDDAAGGRPTTENDTLQPLQPPVVSGMRNTSRILIYIDLPRALAAGLPFHRSANGVILSEGDGSGVLPLQYFERVEDRKTGAVLVRDGAVVGDGGIEAMRNDRDGHGHGGGGGRGGRRGGRGGKRGGAGEAF